MNPMIKPTPVVFQSLSLSELKTLKGLLTSDGIGVLQKVIAAHIADTTVAIVERVPSEHPNQDAHALGAQQGIRNTHIYYKNMLATVDQELQNREIKAKVDKATKSA